ncbi:MAG: O-methyltransferase [Calditrichaeota bacterium]|nr:O-methyltransferase [Calditrichota bacterium]MCB0270410.1 O-methyltransferase [Calditrichota bacterium]MCB0285354.1 O-methyltransferase [Calditrichota bacterium]MCB0301703.1 O-methyltransferase [Calditrichota bacterium]MCB9068475.1 O-methyltransferase [Calditrichia bacterium]
MIVNPDIEQYLSQLGALPHAILGDMEAEGLERNFPIVGPLVGRLLVSLIKFGHVHTVLECGSGFGYSAMWMAIALSENGKITCIEYDPVNIERAKSYFEKAGLAHKVTFIQGNAMEIVPTLSDTYDLIMNDVDKPQYPQLLPLLLDRLRVGGMLIADNVLWKGKVTQPAVDGETRAIQEFNENLVWEKNLWSTFLPLRDGLSLSIKLRK